MKRLPFVLLVVVMTIAFFAFRSKIEAKANPPGKYEQILRLVGQMLTGAHYSPKKVDDAFSQNVFYKYLDEIDPEKNIFLKGDVDSLFNLYGKRIDDEINGAPVQSFIGISKVFNNRIKDQELWTTELLSKPFDFTVNETVNLDGEKLSFSLDQQERKELWRKKLKYMTLERYVDLLDERETNKTKKGYVVKNDAQIEKDARVKTDTLIQRVFNRYKIKFTDEDKFNVFVNAITTTMDPHTEFFPPIDKRYFDEQMSGVFYGIGAGLQYSEGNIKITSINVGSPAAKSGVLQAGDIITKVAQGDGEPVELMGYFVQDAVKLIRGKEGSVVTLTVKKPNGLVKVVKLKREKIENDVDTYARSAVIKDSANNTKIGIIYLPEFYVTFNDPKGRRSYTDVAKEIEKLKAEKVDGIVMDLRYNGGGSLYDVVQMVGLFIDKGPIVQVKDRNNRPQVLKDEDPNVLYTGPLAVMVNELSASASEIFAAAIQDYGRGVVIGSTSTYGKGTVQRNIGLDDKKIFTFDESDIGTIKLTLQKFYRVNGGSTQLKGVASDIVLPDALEYLKLREKDNVDALVYDEIPKADFMPWKNAYTIKQIEEISNRRIAADSIFSIIKRNSEWLSVQNDKSYPLNIVEYRKEKKDAKAKSSQIESLVKLRNKLTVSLLASEINKYNDDKNKQDRIKQWLKGLSEDIYLDQAVKVVSDMINLDLIAKSKS